MPSNAHRSHLDRIFLLTLLVSVWSVMLVMEAYLPWLSAVILLLFFMTVYGWIVSLAMIDQKRRSLKFPKTINTSYQPRISIFVPCHNEESVIEGTVATLMALNYPHYELIVIDDRSTDRTAEILAGLQEQYGERFKFWSRPQGSLSGKSAVLNETLEMANGDVICVFDADAYVEKDFLKNIVHFLADEEVGAVQARKVIANAGHNWLTRCQNYEYSLDAHFQLGRDTIRTSVELRGNGQLVKRTALESVGGWNNYTLTDDLDLSTQLHLAGWDIRFAHKVLVWEEGITQFWPLVRQRRRWAEGSLRRYLEHAGSLMTSKWVSLRTKADMIAYLIEFLFPIWVVSDLTVLGLDYLFGAGGNRYHLISSVILVPFLTVFFNTGLVIAIIRFNKPPFLHAMGWALATAWYMVLVWVPIVFWITVKILFERERSMDWGKTAHFGGGEAPALTGKSKASPSPGS